MFSEITTLTKFLIESGLADDQNFPAITQTGSDRFIVSYPNGSFATMLRNTAYKELYEHQLRHRSYSIRMLDGALIQMSYEFVGSRIEKYRLAFLPSPDLSEFQNNPELYLEDILYADVVDKRAVTVPLRFDFDDRDGVAQGLLHPKSHLTLGQYSNCRIPAAAPITPYLFVEFILRSFYNTATAAVAADLPVHFYDIESCMTTEEANLLHIGVPLTSQRIKGHRQATRRT
ncbi:DUF2290 domain-containing protein [Micromonospora taraxaci]|uniref:DUF2290 domain-containing protein n=1 Tax=Micromonospora taraxaci TaxID=1316803 RepID=UPI0033E69E18